MSQLIKKILIKADLTLVTGMHIGGSKDNVEIGGIDNPVIKAGTMDNQPYIPGSSLKGKIRSLLEQIAGASEVGKNSDINDVFGYAAEGKPSKIIFRDAYLHQDDAKKLKENDFIDMPYTEAKWENVIHRIKGTADHPRQMERVPAGARFKIELVINVWDSEKDQKKSIDMLNKGIEALENDYLGGSGSRGYGQVSFENMSQEEISFQNYLS